MDTDFPSIDNVRASIHAIGPEKKKKINSLLDQEWIQIQQNIAAISDEVRRKYQEIFLRFGKEEYSDQIVMEAQKERIEKGKRLFQQMQEGDCQAVAELDRLMFPHSLPLVGQQKLTCEDLEVTENDFYRSRKACYVKRGIEIVEKIKAGDLSEVPRLSILMALANAPLRAQTDMRMKYEDIGITETWLKELQRDIRREFLKNIVKKARVGDYSQFEVSLALKDGLYTYKELETTKEEFEKLEHVRDVGKALMYLEEVKGGDDHGVYFLTALLQPSQAKPIPSVDYSEIGFTKESFEEWIKQQYKTIGKMWVKECREGDYSHVDSLEAALSYKRITLRAVKITKKELCQWIGDRNRTDAEKILEEIHKGKYDSVRELEILLKGTKVTLGNKEITVKTTMKIPEADLQRWKKERDIMEGMVLRKEIKSGNLTALYALEALLEDKNITLKDVGMKKKDLPRVEINHFPL